MATLDHLVPQVKGGTDSLNNLVCACSYCNSNRGIIDPFRYKRYAAQHKQLKLSKPERDRQRAAKRLQDKLNDPKRVLATWRFFIALVFMTYDEQWNDLMMKELRRTVSRCE